MCVCVYVFVCAHACLHTCVLQNAQHSHFMRKICYANPLNYHHHHHHQNQNASVCVCVCVCVCLCVCVCVCVFQGRVQQLSKTQPLVEEMQTKIHSLEDAKGWLERRLKETEVPGPTQWNPS